MKNVSVTTVLLAGLMLIPGACGSNRKPTDAGVDENQSDADQTGSDAQADAQPDGGSAPLKVVLLQTNDLHSYLQGHDPELDYTPETTGDDTTVGGISRLGARIAAERTKAGDVPVLVLDSGDFMMGTAFELLGASQAAELTELSKLGYDAITLGNHEFDWTPGGLALILGAAAQKGFAVPIVASNLKLDAASTDQGAKAVAAAVRRKLVKTLPNGLKVGLFGLLGKNAVDVTPTIKPLTFDPIATAAAALVKELREEDHVDIVIALSHSGINPAGKGEDADLAKAVPGIDVILSGHTHDTLTTPVTVGTTTITQTGRYGEHLGKLALTVTRSAAGNPTVALDSYELLPIDDTVAGDAPTQARVQAYQTAIDQLITPLAYGKILAKTTFDVTSAGTGETAIGDLVTDSYRTVSSSLTPTEPTAVAIDASGAIRTRLAAGKTGLIAFADAFRVLPLGIGPDSHPGYPLVSLYLNAADLFAGLELSAAAVDTVGSADYVLQTSGLEAQIDATKPAFQRVTGIKVGGTAINRADATTCYKATTTLYVANLLGVVAQATNGALSVKPKEKDCQTLVTDLNAHIIRTGATATSPELKAWQALITYLGGLPQVAGVPTVPDAYMAPQGRVK